MGLTFSVGDLSALVQMVISVLTFIVGLITLIILFRYASDTKTLADSAVKQSEESNIPYLTIETVHRQNLLTGLPPVEIMITNKGRGPAIGIELKGKKVGKWTSGPAGTYPDAWLDCAESIGDLAADENTGTPDWVGPSLAYKELNHLDLRGPSWAALSINL